MTFSKGLFAIRNSTKAFARTPRLTLVLLLTIAVGTGSNVCVFGFVQGLIQPTSPASHGGRIVSIFTQDKTHFAGPLTRHQYQLLRDHHEAFLWIEAARITPRRVGFDDGSDTAIVAEVMPDLAKALNLPMRGGAVIGRRMWQREFSNANVIGHRIRMGDVELPIVGVAPDRLEGLYGDETVDLWTSLRSESLEEGDREARDLWVLACLRDGMSLGEAQKDVRRQLGNSEGVYVAPFSGDSPAMAKGLSAIGAMLAFSSAAVFVVACCVVASLLLGRALKRIHVMSVSVALGATRGDLLMELLSDSIVISIAGGALGFLLAMATARVLPSLLFPEDAERLVFVPHLLTIIASSIFCVAIIIACGFLPVLATTTNRPWNVLQRESGLQSTVVTHFRAVLVVGQITICCVLTIFTSVLLERFHSVLKTNAGSGLGDLVLASVQPQQGLQDDMSYFKAVERNLRSMPGISPLAWTSQVPGSLPAWRSFRIQSPPLSLRDVQLDIAEARGSLSSLQGRLVFGRVFEVQDQSCSVAVVDEDAAAKLLGRDTVGMKVQDPKGDPVEIVGVVKRDSSGKANNHDHPTIYLNDASAAASDHAAVRFRVPVDPVARDIELNVNFVSPDYLHTLGLSVVDGRWFAEDQIGACDRSGVVNQEAADTYFGGRPLSAALIDDNGQRIQIIGVARSQSLGTFEQRSEPTIYMPISEEHPRRMTLVLRASKWDSGAMAQLQRKIESVPGNGPGSPEVKTLSTRLGESGLAPLRIATLIFATSALTALSLSVLGLLSVHSETEAQRRRELALRIALGAQGRHIRQRTIKEVGQLSFVGVLAGTLISIAGLRLFASYLSMISSPPIWVWLLAPILVVLALIITAGAAMYRALRVKLQALMREDG